MTHTREPPLQSFCSWAKQMRRPQMIATKDFQKMCSKTRLKPALCQAFNLQWLFKYVHRFFSPNMNVKLHYSWMSLGITFIIVNSCWACFQAICKSISVKWLGFADMQYAFGWNSDQCMKVFIFWGKKAGFHSLHKSRLKSSWTIYSFRASKDLLLKLFFI